MAHRTVKTSALRYGRVGAYYQRAVARFCFETVRACARERFQNDTRMIAGKALYHPGRSICTDGCLYEQKTRQ